MNFPTDLSEIENRIQQLNPKLYAQTRNYETGSVSYLSPYISRGILSTKQIYDFLKEQDLPWNEIEKLVQELAWRDYWQQVWISEKDEILYDLKKTQFPIRNFEIPTAILEAKTGIEAVDSAIINLYKTGYMHNHMRMYVASICCNIAQVHWSTPAKWMFSHLLDGDIASNHLSWQWIAGTFSNNKYYANQENINHFFNSNQKGTFLDIDYPEFEKMEIPSELVPSSIPKWETSLRELEKVYIEQKPSLIFTYYNLDPNWHKTECFQRILLLEPTLFKKFPVQEKCIDFVLELAKNIPEIKIYVGEFSELALEIESKFINYKEHPTNKHFYGNEEARDWLTPTTGKFSSFHAFWKQSKKELVY